jgi:predicted esterase
VGNDKKFNSKDFLLAIVFIILLAIPGYLSYKLILPLEINNVKGKNDQLTEKQKDPNINDEEETIAKEEDETIKEGLEKQVLNERHYQETFKTINDQTTYIAVPTTIDETNPPTIVIYSHGSTVRVTIDTQDPFIQDLMLYGERFTKNNYIFAASNEHDTDRGKEDSLKDVQSVISWIKNKYPTKDELHMIGFSLGSLTTTHYLAQHPDNITKIVLLAPTTRVEEWTEDIVEKVKGTEIRVWQGIEDINIRIEKTDTFVNHVRDLGMDIEFIRLPGKSHFDVDAEYIEDILEFFNS